LTEITVKDAIRVCVMAFFIGWATGMVTATHVIEWVK